MKIHKLDRKHLNEIKKVENSSNTIIVFGFNKDGKFIKKDGIFIKVGDENVSFMPSDATLRQHWWNIEDMVSDEEMEYYWTTAKEYANWLRRTIRLFIEYQDYE